MRARGALFAALFAAMLLGAPAAAIAQAAPSMAASGAPTPAQPATIVAPPAAAASSTASAPAAAASAPAAPASTAASTLPTTPDTVFVPKTAEVAFDGRPARGERLQITDAYIELRTGPGRGYPVFFVASRNDWIEIELRHTDWFRVRTESGRVGWVNRGQLETTLTAGGVKKSFRDTIVDDFLNRRVQIGASWGQFKSEPVFKIWASVRASETLSVEATYGQVQGVFSGTDFWHLDLVAEPWSDRRISPFVAVGVGKFTNFPNLSLVNAVTTNAKLANASVGVRYYLTDRFVLRADYTLYTVFVSDQRTTEYRAWTGGLAFFF